MPPLDYGPWLYSTECGLYFFEGEGIGLTWAEVEALEEPMKSVSAAASQKRTSTKESQMNTLKRASVYISLITGSWALTIALAWVAWKAVESALTFF